MKRIPFGVQILFWFAMALFMLVDPTMKTPNPVSATMVVLYVMLTVQLVYGVSKGWWD